MKMDQRTETAELPELSEAQKTVLGSIHGACYVGYPTFRTDFRPTYVDPDHKAEAMAFDRAARKAPQGPLKTIDVVPDWYLKAEFFKASFSVEGAIQALIDLELIKVVRRHFDFSVSWLLSDGRRMTVLTHRTPGSREVVISCVVDGSIACMFIRSMTDKRPCYRLSLKGLHVAPKDTGWRYMNRKTSQVVWDESLTDFAFVAKARPRLEAIAHRLRMDVSSDSRIGTLLDKEKNPIHHMKRKETGGGAHNRRIYLPDVEQFGKYLMRVRR